MQLEIYSNLPEFFSCRLASALLALKRISPRKLLWFPTLSDKKKVHRPSDFMIEKNKNVAVCWEFFHHVGKCLILAHCFLYCGNPAPKWCILLCKPNAIKTTDNHKKPYNFYKISPEHVTYISSLLIVPNIFCKNRELQFLQKDCRESWDPREGPIILGRKDEGFVAIKKTR